MDQNGPFWPKKVHFGPCRSAANRTLAIPEQPQLSYRHNREEFRQQEAQLALSYRRIITTAMSSDFLKHKRHDKEFLQRKAKLAICHWKWHRNRERIVAAQREQSEFPSKNCWVHFHCVSRSQIPTAKSSPRDGALNSPKAPHLRQPTSLAHSGSTNRKPISRLQSRQNPIALSSPCIAPYRATPHKVAPSQICVGRRGRGIAAQAALSRVSR